MYTEERSVSLPLRLTEKSIAGRPSIVVIPRRQAFSLHHNPNSNTRTTVRLRQR